MRNSKLRGILAALLAGLMLLSAVACTGGTTDDTTIGDTTAETPTETPTEAPVGTEAPKSGCGATVDLSALWIFSLCALAVGIRVLFVLAVNLKKKQD